MYTLLLCSVICIFVGFMFSFVICKQELCGKVQQFSFSTAHVPFFFFPFFWGDFWMINRLLAFVPDLDYWQYWLSAKSTIGRPLTNRSPLERLCAR